MTETNSLIGCETNLCAHECECDCHRPGSLSVHVMACCTECQSCHRNILLGYLKMHQKNCHPKSKAELFVEALAELDRTANKAADNLEDTVEIVKTNLLDRVDPKHRDACERMFDYLKASPEFLSYWEQDKDCQKAVIEAFALVAEQFETIADSFKKMAQILRAAGALGV